MKIDLTQQYVNGDDTPAVDSQTKEPITLKQILMQVCLNEGAAPDEKVKRFSIWRSIKKSQVPFVLLEAEEIALLKKWVLNTHSTLVVGQTHEMLEHEYRPPAPPASKKKKEPADKPTKFDPDDYKNQPDVEA